MKIILFICTILLIAISISIPVSANFIYQVDDGTGELASGLINGGEITWANQFTANGVSDLITEIRVAVGRPGFSALDGANATANIWNDPNNDGLPNDAILLNSVGGIISNSGTALFNIFDIPDTAISGSFFVGLTMTHTAGTYPARGDGTSPHFNVSWFAIGSDLQAAFPYSDLVSGDLMIRAVGGDTAPIPEPATMLLLGTGLVGVAGAARRKKKNQA